MNNSDSVGNTSVHNNSIGHDSKSLLGMSHNSSDKEDVILPMGLPPLDHMMDAPIYHDFSMCCFGPIANMPFGWPKGSCTALMTFIAMIIFLMGLLGVLAFGFVNNNSNIVLATMGVFSSGFSFVFGHYAGKRTLTKSRDKVKKKIV